MICSLENRRALVCGSTQGIGKAIAIQFARSGAEVTLCARNLDALKRVASELPKPMGQNHSYLVSEFDNLDSFTEQMGLVSKTTSFDIIVNNSGGPPGGNLLNASPEEFITALNRLLLASHVLTQMFVESMKDNRFGRIINIVSTSVRQPIDNLGVSNTIRGATASWSKTLATELAPFGITVNNILPGATSTSRLDTLITRISERSGKTPDEVSQSLQGEIPAGRFGSAEEIAYAATFLASDQAGYITGTSITVDGGRTKAL